MGDRIVRQFREDDLVDALRCIHTAFLSGKDTTDEHAAWAAERWDLTRAWGAFDEGVLCGTSRTFASRMRLPGLGDAPVSCLTSVTVLPTHTRRGHLSRMMDVQLRAAVDAGEVASILVAAEWPIYGRYGYGPCTEWTEWEVDTALAVVGGTPFGSCRIVDPTELEKAATVVLTRHQAETPGSIERPASLVARAVGTDPWPWDKHEGRVRVVHYDDDGSPDAYAYYDPKEKWDGMRPSARLEVEELLAATPEAEIELWRYLVGVDLVDVVKWGGAPTSAVRWALGNGRAARAIGRWDHIWARPLDVAACLSARSYVGQGSVVFSVVDDGVGVARGRYVLDVGADGASCSRAPSGASADVTLGVAALGATWLGGTDLRGLAAAAGDPRWAVDEHTPGAVSGLAALLRWPETPYCATDF